MNIANNLLRYFSSRKNIYLDRDKLDSLRFSLLKKQLLHAYQNIPFYKKAFDMNGINPSNFKNVDDLSNYPIITKDLIRENQAKCLNQKALFRNSFKSHTSGSTGQPMWIHYDFRSWIRKKYLIKMRARMECGIKINDRIAIFETISYQNLKKEDKRFLTSLIKVKYFSVFEPIEKTINSLRDFSPSSVYSLPGHLFRMAQIISKNNLNLSSVKRIFLSSEYLQENVRSYIEKIFKAEVYDIYGSTEFKEIAWECEKHEGYHINEDEVLVEVLKDGKPVMPGIIGNIVGTDLRNITMPLIRFKLYDKGALIKEKCSCGRTFSLMKPYAGRSSEYIVLPNEEILSPYLFTTKIEKISGLLQYQIIQLSKDKLIVSVVSKNENFKKIAHEIKSIFLNITNNLMEIEVQSKTKLDLEENGKFKVVKNLTLEEKKV